MQVVCTGTLIGVEDRALTFEVTCSDAAGVIGKGVHRRFIVDGARFAAKAQSKAQSRHSRRLKKICKRPHKISLENILLYDIILLLS